MVICIIDVCCNLFISLLINYYVVYITIHKNVFNTSLKIVLFADVVFSLGILVCFDILIFLR